LHATLVLILNHLIYLFSIVAKITLFFVGHQASSFIRGGVPFYNSFSNEEFYVHSKPGKLS
jgi:hypothetical protein